MKIERGQNSDLDALDTNIKFIFLGPAPDTQVPGASVDRQLDDMAGFPFRGIIYRSVSRKQYMFC